MVLCSSQESDEDASQREEQRAEPLTLPQVRQNYSAHIYEVYYIIWYENKVSQDNQCNNNIHTFISAVHVSVPTLSVLPLF